MGSLSAHAGTGYTRFSNTSFPPDTASATAVAGGCVGVGEGGSWDRIGRVEAKVRRAGVRAEKADGRRSEGPHIGAREWPSWERES